MTIFIVYIFCHHEKKQQRSSNRTFVKAKCNYYVSYKKTTTKQPTHFSPGWVAHFVGTSSQAQKGLGFDPYTGPMPKLCI